jgi:hypothetical protein
VQNETIPASELNDGEITFYLRSSNQLAVLVKIDGRVKSGTIDLIDFTP